MPEFINKNKAVETITMSCSKCSYFSAAEVKCRRSSAVESQM